jgi:hypothetical protein
MDVAQPKSHHREHGDHRDFFKAFSMVKPCEIRRNDEAVKHGRVE